MSRERFTELCRIDAAGTLEGGELRQLESHLASGGSICERRVGEFSRLVSLPARPLPEPRLVPEIKQRVLNAVGNGTPETGKPRAPEPAESMAPVGFGSWLPWVCAAVVGLALVFSMWNQRRLNQELAIYQAGLVELTGQVRELQAQLDRGDGAVAFSNDPSVQELLLSGTPKSPEARGKVLWSAQQGRARFYASKLPQLSREKTYQLWLIADQPVGAGTFRVNPAGQGFLEVVGLAGSVEAVKFAVSMEPAGGAPHLTGDIYLTGAF